MFTSEPFMLPKGMRDITHVEIRRNTEGDDPAFVVSVRQGRDGELTPTTAIVYDKPDIEGTILSRWMREHFFVVCSNRQINITEQWASFNVVSPPLKATKGLTRPVGGPMPSYSWVALPDEDDGRRYTLIDPAALPPMFDAAALGKARPDQLEYAELEMPSHMYGKRDGNGLAICQWLVQQGYGIMYFAVDDGPGTPLFHITAKTPLD